MTPLLMFLGILAWSAMASLHGQALQPPGKPPSSAPKERIAVPVLDDDLTRVPEVRLQAVDKAVNAEAIEHIARQITKINRLNEKKPDSFIEALRSERRDLRGLSFVTGDACRTKGERRRQFTQAAALVREALETPVVTGLRVSGGEIAIPDNAPEPPITFTDEPTSQAVANPVSAETFWEKFRNLRIQDDRAQGRVSREKRQTITVARIAALRQILMPMAKMHPGLVEYLSTLAHVEATRALARLAIFSGDEDVREAAIKALQLRREGDYTKILLEGLHYPWPAVARRAAEAIVKLNRRDLLPHLIKVLEQADPRAPVIREVKGKRVSVVRELVRVNHHRSCLLCHAPGNSGDISADTLRAEVPVPGQPLTDKWERCRKRNEAEIRENILVRIDVTYLRQDFSALLPVADAAPWPTMQRFDFLVRSRELTDEEARTYRAKLTPRESSELSPYQHAALTALRELSGRDTEPTPEAWRRLLERTKTP